MQRYFGQLISLQSIPFSLLTCFSTILIKLSLLDVFVTLNPTCYFVDFIWLVRTVHNTFPSLIFRHAFWWLGVWVVLPSPLLTHNVQFISSLFPSHYIFIHRARCEHGMGACGYAGIHNKLNIFFNVLQCSIVVSVSRPKTRISSQKVPVLVHRVWHKVNKVWRRAMPMQK